MKKTLVTFIFLLIALTLACVLFIFGWQSVKNNSSDKEEKKEEQIYRTESDKKDTSGDDAVSGDKIRGNTDDHDEDEEDEDFEDEDSIKVEEIDVEEKEEKEEKEEEKGKEEETSEKGNKGIVIDDNYPSSSEEQKPQQEMYRVRKSASDATSQKGAFQSLENAKALADQYKGEGYAVYNDNMECVYKP